MPPVGRVSSGPDDIEPPSPRTSPNSLCPSTPITEELSTAETTLWDGWEGQGQGPQGLPGNAFCLSPTDQRTFDELANIWRPNATELNTPNLEEDDEDFELDFDVVSKELLALIDHDEEEEAETAELSTESTAPKTFAQIVGGQAAAIVHQLPITPVPAAPVPVDDTGAAMIPKFNGNILFLTDFLEAINTHLNPALPEAQKYTILKSKINYYLQKIVTSRLSSTTSTPFTDALNAIDRYFARPGHVLHCLRWAMSQLKTMSSTTTSGGQWETAIDQAERTEARLWAAGLMEYDGEFGTAFIRRVLRAQDRTVFDHFVAQGYLRYTLDGFINYARYRQSVAVEEALQANNSSDLCPLCCIGNHSPDECYIYQTIPERLQVVVDRDLCYRCLNPRGPNGHWTCQIECNRCGLKNHHTAICRRMDGASGLGGGLLPMPTKRSGFGTLLLPQAPPPLLPPPSAFLVSNPITVYGQQPMYFWVANPICFPPHPPPPPPASSASQQQPSSMLVF